MYQMMERKLTRTLPPVQAGIALHLILINFWAGKEQACVEQRSKQTALWVRIFPRSCYASRSPEQVCHVFCWRANPQKLLQSVRKSCQFVKLTTWRKRGVLVLFDEKAQATEHNTRGWNTALFQNVRVHLVPDWLGELTDTKLDQTWPVQHTPCLKWLQTSDLFSFHSRQKFHISMS